MGKKEKDVAAALRDNLVFGGLEEEEFISALSVLGGRVKELPPGSTYKMGGERVDRIGIILDGSLILSKMMESGAENLIQKLGTGYLVNAPVTCSPTRINPFFIHTEEGAVIYEFPYDNLLFGEFPKEQIRTEIMKNLLQHLANENIRRQYKIDVLSENGLRDRILIYLESRAGKLGQKEFTIPFNREEMANYLCVNRSALSHELSLMRSEGLIRFRKNKFALLYFREE